MGRIQLKSHRMGVDVNNKREWTRLILAALIAPAVPLLGLSTTLWQSSGSKAWFPLVFIFGYCFFFLFGLPVIGMLLKKRTIFRCSIGGGSVTIAPILLLSLFSLSSTNQTFQGDMLFHLLLLFIAGAVGGILFWVLAFMGTKAN